MPIAEFHVDSPILRTALEAVPDAVATFEEQYAHGGAISFLFWVETPDDEAFESALAGDPTVADPVTLVETADRRLYRVTLTERGLESSTYSLKSELDIVVLDATGTSEGWSVRMRFPDQAAIAAYDEACREQGLGVEIRTKYSEDETDCRAKAQLTAPQREALDAAFDGGYFEVPRDASLQEIADELDVSRQATSERIRRGLSALLDREFGTRP